MMKRSLVKKIVVFFSFMVLSWVFQSFVPPPAEAMPSFTRKYNADCAMCHYPNVPRLNTLGHKFRRAGYRMPDEFNKDQDINNVSNFVSLRGRVRYEYEDGDSVSTKSEFELHDATLFYAGPFSQNFSAFTEAEFEPGNKTDGNGDPLAGGETEVALLSHIQGIMGNADHFSTFRVGQMHTLYKAGFGGFDRPTAITDARIFSDNLTSSGLKFKLKTNQRGLELAHVIDNTRLIAQVLNGVDSSGSGIHSDVGTAKDYSLTFEQIIDDMASGLTLHAYWGTWYDNNDLSVGQQYGFARYVLTANKVFPHELDGDFEIIGGFARSEDNAPSGADVEGNAFFVELEQFFDKKGFTVLVRYDYLDPNDTISDDLEERWTLGYVRTLQSRVRLAVEGEVSLDDENSSDRDYKVLTELMVNF